MIKSISAYLYGCRKHNNGIHHSLCECYIARVVKILVGLTHTKMPSTYVLCINTTCNAYKATTINLQIVPDIYKWSNKLMFNTPKWNCLIVNRSTNG